MDASFVGDETEMGVKFFYVQNKTRYLDPSTALSLLENL